MTSEAAAVGALNGEVREEGVVEETGLCSALTF